MPSQNIGVIFLKRQLSRHKPVNAHALFGGFGCKGSVNHSGMLSSDAVISLATSATTFRIPESAFSGEGASQESEGNSFHLLATLSQLVNLRS